ncbi:MAG: hypothetical protein Q7R30_22820 [Acidobacteriota bacterium]|nr:hypothetical protein [Acidobacteriota bacterium]
MSANVAGYTREDGTRVFYSSALSDEAGKAYTLLCCGEEMDAAIIDGKIRVAPDGETPVTGELSACFMVAFMQVYGRPWGNDKFTRDTWVKHYKAGVEELASLGIVETPLFDKLGQPSCNQFGFPRAHGFHRDRVEPGVITLKEGIDS